MMQNNSVKTVAEILPEYMLALDGRVKGGIPEPHRSEIFGIVGLNPSKKLDNKNDKR